MSKMTQPRWFTSRTLREVAKLRRAEMDREADRAWLEAERDVEILERVAALRRPEDESRRVHPWQHQGRQRAA